MFLYRVFSSDVSVQLLLGRFLDTTLFNPTFEGLCAAVVFMYMKSKMCLLNSTVVTLVTLKHLLLRVCSFVLFKYTFMIIKVTTVQTLVISNTLVYIPDMTAKIILTSISIVTLGTLVDLLWFNTTVNFPFHSRATLVFQ